MLIHGNPHYLKEVPTLVKQKHMQIEFFSIFSFIITDDIVQTNKSK